MLSAFASAFRTPDLRNKLLFTLGIVAIFRLGSVVPTPGVDYKAIRGCIALVQDQSVYGLINLFSGGALLKLSVFARGIMPYITASIIMQILAVVIPKLQEWQQQGAVGQRKTTQWTRYVTIGIAILQSTGLVFLFHNGGGGLVGVSNRGMGNEGLFLAAAEYVGYVFVKVPAGAPAPAQLVVQL